MNNDKIPVAVAKKEGFNGTVRMMVDNFGHQSYSSLPIARMRTGFKRLSTSCASR